MILTVVPISIVILSFTASKSDGSNWGSDVVSTFVDHHSATEWRRLYGRLFWVVPRHDPKMVEGKRISAKEAQHIIDRLRGMLYSSRKDELEQISFKELEEVEFWSSISEFEPSSCHIEKDVSLLNRYSKSLPSRNSMRPNLEVYLNHVEEELLEYCLRMQDKIIVKPIEGSISTRDRQLISQFGSESIEPTVYWEKVADYFAPYYSKKRARCHLATLHRETHKIFDHQLRAPCKNIRGVSSQAKDAIWYLKSKEALTLASPIARDWIRLERICTQITRSIKFLASLAPTAIKKYYKAHKDEDQGWFSLYFNWLKIKMRRRKEHQKDNNNSFVNIDSTVT